jgi:branched-subunit amino acid permease
MLHTPGMTENFAEFMCQNFITLNYSMLLDANRIYSDRISNISLRQLLKTTISNGLSSNPQKALVR